MHYWQTGFLNAERRLSASTPSVRSSAQGHRQLLRQATPAIIGRLPDPPAQTMHKILILTADPDSPTAEPVIVLKGTDGASQTFHHVDTIDGLLHYRNEAISEEDARELIA
jgi:hypothetical protein